MELQTKKTSTPTKNHEPKRQTTSLDTANFNAPLLTIEETLKNFGMQKNEIKVYLHLAENGSQKAKDICSAIQIHRTETYRLLRHLEKKGLVYSVFGKPVLFSAIPLEKAMDLMIHTQRTNLEMLENQKDVLVGLWASRAQRKHQTAEKGLFQKLEGQQQIILKINEILEKTAEEFQVFVSDEYMAELYYGGFFDNLIKLRSKLKVTLLTEVSQKSTYFLDKIKWPKEKRRMTQEQNLPCFIISDNKELLVAFTEGEPLTELGHKKKVKNLGVWTNYSAVVAVLQMLFKKLDLHAMV